MKKILCLTGIVALLTTSGCIILEGGRHGHARRYEHHDTVIVRPPEVIVR